MDAPQRMTRGANDPDIVWGFRRGGQPVPLADDYELEIFPLNSASIHKRSGGSDLTIEPDTSRVRWRPTIDEARAISRGEGTYKLWGTVYVEEDGVRRARRRLWARGAFLVED